MYINKILRNENRYCLKYNLQLVDKKIKKLNNITNIALHDFKYIFNNINITLTYIKYQLFIEN